ncbi:MAG: ATPase domain-containing protein [Elusimicrobiota bacterium]
MKDADHQSFVDAWLETTPKSASPTELIELFASAWGVLWRRAEGAIGEVVLASIAALVRSDAVERHPFLSSLTLDSPIPSFKALIESAGALEEPELRDGLRFMLTEFITIVADMTDQIITQGLYDELSRVAQGSNTPAPVQRPARRHESAVEEAQQKETSMTTPDESVTTGIHNLDTMLAGGLIKGSSVAITGLPGSGKTILAQQIAFHHATPSSKVLYFSTLSEPGTKTLLYLNKLSYFDQDKYDKCVHFVDLGILLRTKVLQQTLEIILEHVRKVKPALVVVDSFKVFEDMAASSAELRKFSYELVVNFMTRRCTTIFIGEYAETEFERNPLFAIIDGLISLTQRELSGEEQRFIHVVKMRGLPHSSDEHAFRISADGIEVFAPRLMLQHAPPAKSVNGGAPRCHSGIRKLDDLFEGGIPRGSSLLLSGVAGTGKTVLGLEFIFRGALAGEKGILISFEETGDRLLAAARGLGFDLDAEVARGMVEIVFIPQPDILVEQDLVMINEKVSVKGVARVVVDSLSVFLHKITEQAILREKVFQLASIVQNTDAVGLFVTDVPYGSNQISRFGVEETVVDGILILSSTEEGLERQRYIEAYKLRNTAHLKGRHSMIIEKGGMQIFPRYQPQEEERLQPPPAKIQLRLSLGVAGLDRLLDSGLLARSVTLVSGSSGIGKSILALQFLLEGAARGEPGLYVTLEEGPEELLANAAALDLPLKKAVDDNLVDIVYLPPTHIRSTQFLTVLTDRIKEQKSRRLVLDSTTHIVASGMSPDDVRDLLYDLVVRFKNLGVTSLFTLESDLMFSMESSTDTYRGFAALADNVLLMRYSPGPSKMASTLMVVKTRGSTHDKGLFSIRIGKGGLHLGAPIDLPGRVFAPAEERRATAVSAARRH